MRSGLAIAFVLVACALPTLSSDGTTTGGSTGASTGDSSSGTAGSSGVVDGSSSGESGLVWPPDDALLTCIEMCEGPFDCCPGGTAGSCPGPYPYNIDCVAGFCVPGQCESDEECGEGQTCTLVGGLRICVVLCDDDPAVCTQPNSGLACTGQTDEGQAYCFESCDSGFVSCGNQTCDPDSGQCVCTDSGQCINGWTCV